MRLSKLLISALFSSTMLGCTQDYKSGQELVDIAINGLPEAQLTEQQRLDLGFAALYIKYGEHPRTYIALAKANQDQRIWAATDGITLVTRNGQIIRSDGLPFANSGVRYQGQNPFTLGLISASKQATFSATRDFISEGLFNVSSHSTFTLHETSTQMIAGSERQVQRVSEQLAVPSLNFHTTNQYWVEQSNHKQVVWRSEQQLGPDQPIIFLETLMPYYDDI
ncbi:YjbF family lipoprotein [Agarivorans sp. QJM3NY_33]|uniref:YjbF family lipoprotein n=1 Tax=Agarivorans sp. QJM3NY_33 TaxID=3421432 RepID=UPI003D7E4755